MPGFMKTRSILIFSLFISIAAALAFLLAFKENAHLPPPDNAAILPAEHPITFTDGQRFSLMDAPRPYTLLFMGFTRCPDMCPTTLHLLETLYHALPPEKRHKAHFVFLSLHPEADTPGTLKSYFAYANLPLLSAAPPIAHIKAITRHYSLFLERKDIHSTPPVIYHSGDILLLDNHGKLIKRFPFNADYHALFQEISAIIP